MALRPHSADAHAEVAMTALPPGRAWSRNPDGVLGQLVAALSVEFARVEARAFALIDESDPLSAFELLPDWERLTGLPDTCAPIAVSVRDRQIAVARKLATQGGQSHAFLVELAARIGVAVEIIEFAPFTTESTVAGDLYDDSWAFVFEVRVLPESAIFTEGDAYQDGWLTTESGVDETLRSFGIDGLECLIARAKPAHTTALITYPEEPEPVLWFDHLSDQGAY